MKLLPLIVFLFQLFISHSTQLEEVCRLKTIDSVCREDRTLIIVKPDGVQRGLVGQVIQRYEAKGLKLIAIKMLRVRKMSFLIQKLHTPKKKRRTGTV